MEVSRVNFRRRRQLVQGIAMLAGVAKMLAAPQPAMAKAVKSDFLYQDRPHDGKRCAECKHYLPGRNDQTGACDIIEGTVSADGWCAAFTKKR